MDIQQAYKAFKEGKTVIINSREKVRKTKDALKYIGKPIPAEGNFIHYVWHYQFWTNSHPVFEVVE